MKQIDLFIVILVLILVTTLFSPLLSNAFDDNDGTNTDTTADVVSLAVNRVAFSPDTTISNLEYEGEASFDNQLLGIKAGSKPVIEIHNTTHGLWDLSVSYTPFKVNDKNDNDLRFALRSESGSLIDSYKNKYMIFEPDTAQLIHKASKNDIIYFVPWGEGDDDLLKIFLSSYRHDLNGKDIVSELTWTIEVTPTSGDEDHVWSDWENHSRKCLICGYNDPHDPIWGAWKSDGEDTHSKKCELCPFVETKPHEWGDWGDWIIIGGTLSRTRHCIAEGCDHFENEHSDGSLGVLDAGRWSSVAYGNDLFVVVASGGGNSRVMTSPDGNSWTLRYVGNVSLNDIFYGNGVFVAVGYNIVKTSSDGINWTSVEIPGNWRSVTGGVVNGSYLFAAVSSVGTLERDNVRILISSDGVNWTSVVGPHHTQNWHAITFGNGMFVATEGGNYTMPNRILTSVNGISWSIRSVHTVSSSILRDASIHGVTYGLVSGEHRFVAVGHFRRVSNHNIVNSIGNTGIAMRHQNPGSSTNWTQINSFPIGAWRDVHFANGVYVAVANVSYSESLVPGVNRIVTSANGINWVVRATTGTLDNSGGLYGVTFGNGKWVAVGDSGVVVSNDNGTTWSYVPHG
jgi:hypothetical protein